MKRLFVVFTSLVLILICFSIPAKATGDKLEVSIGVTGKYDKDAVVFEIETNLPDETELILTLSSGDYNKASKYTGQTKVAINNGKATTDGFSNKGEKLTGDFDLSVSMSIPKLQSEAVQKVIGKNGENMTGNAVTNSSVGSSKVVKALFAVTLDKKITITSENDYSSTTFAKDTDKASTEDVKKVLDQYSDTDKEKERVEKQIQAYIDKNYTFTTIDSITINPNLGTDDEKDYIALVNLTWDQKNSGKTSKSVLDMYSSDMAARVYEDLPELSELAVFWNVPYLKAYAKISFERKKNGMAYSDTYYDSAFDK